MLEEVINYGRVYKINQINNEKFLNYSFELDWCRTWTKGNYTKKCITSLRAIKDVKDGSYVIVRGYERKGEDKESTYFQVTGMEVMCFPTDRSNKRNEDVQRDNYW